LTSQFSRTKWRCAHMVELLGTLLKRRSAVDSRAEVFESQPEDSSADFCAGLTFSGSTPTAQEWLKSRPKSEEEDRVAELLALGLEGRGPRPEHAPTSREGGAPDVAGAAAGEDVESARRELQAERECLKRAAADLELREHEMRQLSEREQTLRAELEAMRESKIDGDQREQALRDELEELRQRKQHEKENQDYPLPAWLDQAVGTANVGVVGESGVGKSLLINKLRNLPPAAEGWAPVGVNETTMEPTMYPFPNEPRVRFWDLPGAGTTAFPREEYLATMGLRYFDAVLVVSAGRFTETEVALAKELENHGVPFFMVRTKVDIDVWNNEQDNSVDEATTLQQIRADLSRRGVVHPYLVSSRERHKHDMMNLLCDIFPILRQLPDLESVGDGFDSEAWLLPDAYSELISRVQGCWRTTSAVYIVQGHAVHVTRADGSCGMTALEERESKVWWSGNFYVDKRATLRAQRFGELRWEHRTRKTTTILWHWVG